jgi:hypothetical protein
MNPMQETVVSYGMYKDAALYFRYVVPDISYELQQLILEAQAQRGSVTADSLLRSIWYNNFGLHFVKKTDIQ